ncbi:Nuclear envelope morphology protein 1 [Ceratocystis pirilliformis]|uniref:Nuclear envelope morphology protein 1 n=1 Tax=Ceratocystis pirilliformis TaxID=259994 RepID=A0ABR3Z9C4_9PEZI
MNSLNIISSRVSPQNSPTPSRTNSFSSLGLMRSIEGHHGHSSLDDTPESDDPTIDAKLQPIQLNDPDSISNLAHASNPLTQSDPPLDASFDSAQNIKSGPSPSNATALTAKTSWLAVPQRIASCVIGSLRWILSTIAAPGFYLLALFYDKTGRFRPLLPFRTLFDALGLGFLSGSGAPKSKAGEKHSRPRSASTRHRRKPISTSTSTSLSSQTRSSGASKRKSSISMSSDSDTPSRRRSSATSRPRDGSQDTSTPSRSIRIKVQASDEALKERRHRKTGSSVSRAKASGDGLSTDISAQIKSPTSQAGSAITKYPRAPAPPRPLIPRRQPSYLNFEGPPSEHQKTLILDLDETLIHSMSKGNRLGSGHMVEVRLNTAFVGMGGQMAVGPQHPILYYVHKRPHCDDFLRRISKWYKLVVFTASVQEYADPVIDWLESERKYFAARFYRQHCTFRQNAFIKDLSAVEPDLSKVMILDNSPLSYMFHQDNAIPIQGWINDPTDNDLLNIVPLLEGLQYVSDVRALLALRGGEDGQHMA